MEINFCATEVKYNEAIDGEIVQVVFDENPNDDPLNKTSRYLCISQNYEFPGKPSLEWHDGEDYDGGSEVQSYELTSDLFKLTTMDGLNFRIKHSCQNDVLIQIQDFLQSEFKNL